MKAIIICVRDSFGRIYSLVILCLLLITSFNTHAQTDSQVFVDVPRHEIGISMGIYPNIGIWDPSRSGQFGHHDHYQTPDGDTIDSWLIGAFTFNYFYNITRFHAIGIQSTLAFRHITTSYTDNPYQEPVSPLIKTLGRNNDVNNSLIVFWTWQASYHITLQTIRILFPIFRLFFGIHLIFYG